MRSVVARSSGLPDVHTQRNGPKPYVLYVGGIAETLAVRCHAVGTGAGGFEQEGVAVVEEVHAFGRQLVDGGYLPAQRLLYAFMELFGLFGHHPVRLFVGEPCGVVAARPRVVERGLVGAQVHVDALRGEAFPQVDDVALVGERYGLLLFACPADAGDELVQRSVHLVYPALRMARVHGLRIDFGDDAHHAGDDARFGLGARHAA